MDKSPITNHLMGNCQNGNHAMKSRPKTNRTMAVRNCPRANHLMTMENRPMAVKKKYDKKKKDTTVDFSLEERFDAPKFDFTTGETSNVTEKCKVGGDIRGAVDFWMGLRIRLWAGLTTSFGLLIDTSWLKTPEIHPGMSDLHWKTALWRYYVDKSTTALASGSKVCRKS
ncbi:hypothetical protein K469DRAFT_693381 [Zopfia rhizophila CBS 207.26]|uniref:Uncharacterized protein n=1 Tax=Zopfia rhizophila CBS 207.26 TaxID=1314779 RepID=A0A6A6DL36_9PEZI|nr:hypothetical protein K469DRAFT_693381 [Zopfia rhizophila CBS 207.26]